MIPDKSEKPYCAYPFERVRVTCEGDIYFCCFQRRYALGNILEKSFDDIWFSDLAEEIRSSVLGGQLHKHCQDEGCPYLYQKNLNKVAGAHPLAIPRLLEIDLPNYHCNIGGFSPNAKTPACLMCERSMPGYRFQKVDRLEEILPKLAHLIPELYGIHIQGVAEAFWHDYLFKALDLLEYDRNRDRIQVSTTTNGIGLNDERRRRFFARCPMSSVSFSLDAASSETYKKIRRLDAYEHVVRNLISYGIERKRHKKALLRIQNNINIYNVHEVAGMVDVAALAQVDAIEFNPTSGYLTEILVNKSNAHLFKAAELTARRQARSRKVNIEFLRPLDLGLSETRFSSSPAPLPYEPLA